MLFLRVLLVVLKHLIKESLRELIENLLIWIEDKLEITNEFLFGREKDA